TLLTLVPGAHAGATGTFIVLYRGNSVPSGAAGSIQAAGGTLVYGYAQIGVAIARSDSPSFSTNLQSMDASVQGAVATSAFATQLRDLNSGSKAAAVKPLVPRHPVTTTCPRFSGTWT